ncbi:hypothetical protein HBH69_225820 [Parastagonospora nodorum]|nr:hypothetical protein HBH69_225820 [Parastagonospora nodorum]
MTDRETMQDSTDHETPQVFENSNRANHERYQYLKRSIEGSDLRWPATSAAYNLRYRLDYYGLHRLASMHYAVDAATALEHPSLDKHAAEFYRFAVPKNTLMRRCIDIDAHTGGTSLDLQFRLYLHAINLPFWRPGGYYQDNVGVRWTPDMSDLDYLNRRRDAQRQAGQVFQVEVNRGDQPGPAEDQILREPEHPVAQQHRRNTGWWRRVLHPIVWLLGLNNSLLIFSLKLLATVLVLVFGLSVRIFGLPTVLSTIRYAALACVTMAAGIAWSYIRLCCESIVGYFRSPACPAKACLLTDALVVG